MSAREDLTRRWKTHVLTADGAMGTLLIARGADVASCVELLNMTSPDVVAGVHRDYLAAGAVIVLSNTFAANRLKLAAHELRPRLREINQEGVKIARAIANGTAAVGASVGPLGALLWPFGIVSTDEARNVFAEHIDAVATANPDFLALETFGSIAECLLALSAAKQVAHNLPVLASISIADDGKTLGGDPLNSAFARLLDAGADAVGINCAVGPQAIADALERLETIPDAPLSVMPNAGYPHRLDDRTVYDSSPEYFARFARRFVELGASVVGGCCGTTPAHIEAVARELQGRMRATTRNIEAARGRHPRQALLQPEAPRRPVSIGATAFERKLGRQFVFAVEISAPRGPDATQALSAARMLEAAGADCVHITDNPTARLRMSSTALAHLIHRDTKLATILHLSCRDRNLLALQSELLGAAALGVTGILALTGDPSNAGDFPKATSVFDVTALGLTQIVRDLNLGKDHAGNDIGEPTHLRIGVAINPAALTLRTELDKLEQKLQAGADFAVTQPIFELASLEPILEWTRQRALPVLVGVLLLRDHRNAEFLHNEVPGMQVPDAIRKRLAQAHDQGKEAMTIAADLLVELGRCPGVAGVYLIPQDRYDAAIDAMQAATRLLSSA